MATPGPINSSEVEKARAEALHEINQTELALTDQLGKAARPVGQLGYEGAYNAGRRAEYIAILQENVGGFNAQANELAAAGDLQGLRALAEAAVDARNQALVLTREKITQLAKGLSRAMKKEGVTLQQMLGRKAHQLYRAAAFNELNQVQQSEVLLAVIGSSGKTNRAVDKFAKFAGKAGKVLVVAAIAATVFSIAASESPLETVGWCAGEFAVGYIGSKLAVAAITGSATLVAALGPAGVCLLTLVALGGVAVGTYFLFEHLGGMFRKKPPEEWRPASEVIVPVTYVEEVYEVNIQEIFGVDRDTFFRANPIWRMDESMYSVDPSKYSADRSMYSADRSKYSADLSKYGACP